MSFKTYSVLWTVLFCFGLPSVAFGQYILKETVKVKKDSQDQGVTYAVIYAEGLAGAAQWAPGVKMMRNGATIRHQVSKGNEGNLSVNDRIPFRFIVAPTDVGSNNMTWEDVQGVTDATNDNANFLNKADKGCRSYVYQFDKERKWRVPTQRELQLMWLFRGPIGLITENPMEGTVSSSGAPKKYWASTESGSDNAWFFEFEKGNPFCGTQNKNSRTGMVRCVSDY